MSAGDDVMRASVEQLLGAYPVVLDIAVAWGEMDAFGHVNNAVFFRYFESARIAYFARLEFMKLMEETGIGPILAATQCRFRAPLSYPDTVSVGARISDIGSDRFVMEYLVASHRLAAVAAEGDGTVVSYDYRDDSKAPLPAELVRRIRALQQV